MNWLGIIVLVICLVPAWEVGVRFARQVAWAAATSAGHAPSPGRRAAIAVPGTLLLFIPCLIGGFLLEWAALSPFAAGEGWTALTLYVITIAGFAVTFGDGWRNNSKHLERINPIAHDVPDERGPGGRIAAPRPDPRARSPRFKRTHKPR